MNQKTLDPRKSSFWAYFQKKVGKKGFFSDNMMTQFGYSMTKQRCMFLLARPFCVFLGSSHAAGFIAEKVAVTNLFSMPPLVLSAPALCLFFRQGQKERWLSFVVREGKGGGWVFYPTPFD